MDKKNIIEEFDKRISFNQHDLKLLKGLLELIEYLNANNESELSIEKKELLKKFNEESLDGRFDEIISICSLTRISKIELYIISKHFFLSKYSWEKLYFLRVAILNIYETINTYNKYSKKLKEISENKTHLPFTFAELGTKLRQFKKQYNFDTKMSNVRNTTIGHISMDYNKYYTDVKSIDSKENLEMIHKFISILDDIYDYSILCLLNKPMDNKIEINEVHLKIRLLIEENIC